MMNLKQTYETFGVTPSNFYARWSEGSLPLHTKNVINGRIFIDENYFIKRKNFKINKLVMAQEMLNYVLLYMNSSQVARYLTTKYSIHSETAWTTFMSGYLYRRVSDRFLDYKVSRMQWRFIKAIRWLAMDLTENRDRNIRLEKLVQDKLYE